MADDMFSVTGKVAVITGGAGVLCGHMGQALASRGVRVALVDVNAAGVERVAREITSAGGSAIGIEADVLHRGALEAARDTVLRAFGSVDVLVNGAGGNRREATAGDAGSFFDMPEEALRWVFDLNFHGVVLASQVFGRVMVERDSGSIVNISSVASFRPLTKVISYSAAKASINSFTQWLAVHLSQNYSKNIRANAIAPGFFITHQNRSMLTDERSGDLTDRGRSVLLHTPMGRFGLPEDLIGALVWLVSDASRYVTGAVIPVDGGFTAFAGV